MDQKKLGLTQNDFRKLLSTPRTERQPDLEPSLEKRRGGNIPKTPRHIPIGNSTESQNSHVFEKPKPRKFNSEKSQKPKDESTETKYRDRAAERRKGINIDYKTSESIIEKFQQEVSSTPQVIRGETEVGFMSSEVSQQTGSLSTLDYEQSKYFGGDTEYTHLVKGLDFLLLEKMRSQQTLKENERTEEILDEELDKKLAELSENQIESSKNSFPPGIKKNLADLEEFEKLEIQNIKGVNDDHELIKEYSFSTKIGKNMGISLNRLRNRYKIFAKKQILGNEYINHVNQNELFLPLKLYYLFDSLKSSDISLSSTGERGVSAVPTTVVRSQADATELGKHIGVSYSAGAGDSMVLGKVANAIQAAYERKSQLREQRKQKKIENAGRDYVVIPKKNIHKDEKTIGSHVSTVNSEFIVDYTEETISGSDNEMPVTGPYPNMYESDDEDEQEKNVVTSGFDNSNVGDNDKQSDDDFEATGPYPLDDFEATGPYPLDDFEAIGPYPLDDFEATGPYPLDDFDDESTEKVDNYQDEDGMDVKEIEQEPVDFTYEQTQKKEFISKNVNRTFLGSVSSAGGGYNEYEGEIFYDSRSSDNEGDDGIGQNGDLLAMDIGSTSKFKKSQLSRFDFDSIEEWQEYKDSIVQMPKAAFQFGVKSKDSNLRAKSGKIVNKKRKIASSNIQQSERKQDKKQKEKIDREWQQTKQFMAEKYGKKYFD
ncbi:hypothetical protein BB558_006047 [Smittium angustum]|uniref:Protein Red n=1 Tax=Smittium angustum TaxID=133377 RepID=A0A2U1IZ07_SMIAN|nr:hypothetical protein BB558_006047 [Smittium angustum]